jgi:hypothetical protein
MPRCIVFVVCAIAFFGMAPLGADAKEWWGEKLPDPPTQFIFGYGSLIETASRDSSVGKTIPAIPVRVSAAFGYIRSWNDRSPSGFTALGLRKARDGEAGRTVIGTDMAHFDAREAGYVRVEIPQADIEAVGWQRLPESGHIWVYVPFSAAKGDAPGEDLPGPDAAFPLLQSYIDVVIQGGLEYGQDFAREIIETTDGWNQFWLNDRELARRPWVRDPAYIAVDRLLANTAPSSGVFPSRMFSEDYAARWRGVLAK